MGTELPEGRAVSHWLQVLEQPDEQLLGFGLLEGSCVLVSGDLIDAGVPDQVGGVAVQAAVTRE